MIFATLLLLQDAAPLPPVVESCYHLEREGRHVGYASETYESGKSWRREVVEEGRVQIDQADLREGAVKLTSWRGDAHATLEWTPDWPIADIRSYGGGNMQVRLKTPALPLELTLYALRRDGALAAPGRITPRVVDLDGEWPSVPELPMDIAPLVEVEAFGRRPRMTTITFPEGCPGLGFAMARVDRFGRLFDGTLRDGRRLHLVKGETEAVGEFPRGPFRETGCFPRQEKR